MPASFVHLHVHSHYSLLDGLGKIPELLNRCRELEMPALALTDHGVLYGAVEFAQEAAQRGIKPIIGMEAYVTPGKMTERTDGGKNDERARHLVLLARDDQGYENLVRLTTAAHLKGFYRKPRFDYDFLAQHTAGLIVLTGCVASDLSRSIISRQHDRVHWLLRFYCEHFGKENVYLELQHHPTIPEQKIVNEALIQLSRRWKLPLVATADTHYVHPEDASAHDVLLAVQTNNRVTDKDRLTMLGENYSLIPPKEMEEHFAAFPEAITNTLAIAEKCNFNFAFGETQLPRFPVPAKHTPQSYLQKLTEMGLKFRYPQGPDQKILARLRYELEVIRRTGFASYFLIVHDVVNWAKKHGILVGPGRGSAAGSLVSYLLGITNLDPLKHDLVFERFLNPARVAMPDIDIDFADTRRDEVIEYTRRKYGADHVAQIITFGTMAARAAVRDAGRALGFPYDFCDRVAKAIPFGFSLARALEQAQDLRQLYGEDPQVRRLVDTARRLEGVARHASTHACGVVITRDPIIKHVPLQHTSQNDRTIITQYSLQAIESLGLLKMDFLGLKNLTILENTLKRIKVRRGIELSLEQIPLDDTATYRLLQRGETTGVFQLESAGMRRYLRELKPTDFEDIIAMVALFRPGPMELIPQYIAGKHGRVTPRYAHPKLEPILRKTHGIAVYQEQVMQIARDFAGFSLGDADVLRKAVGKKIPELLKKQKERFVKGAVAQGASREVAEKVFAFIEPFAGYAFNRSHAACYALIAYHTAYLKTHYPAEFMAALLTADENNTDRVAIEVAECVGHNIPVLPPDVNESGIHFTIVSTKDEKTAKSQPAIRFGLAAIKNVGSGVVREILRERRKNGIFRSLEDFLSRLAQRSSTAGASLLNKKILESLAKAGALDALVERQQFLANLDLILDYLRSAKRHQAGQVSLFGDAFQTRPKLQLRPTNPASLRTKLSWEKELLGLYISSHPLAEVRDVLLKHAVPIRELITPPYPPLHQRHTIGGVITNMKIIRTRTDERMLFATVEDFSGSMEVIVFPRTLAQQEDFWKEDIAVLLTGKLSLRDQEAKLIVDTAELLTSASATQAQHVVIEVPPSATRHTFLSLRAALQASSQQQGMPVWLEITDANQQRRRLRTSFRVGKVDILRERVRASVPQATVKLEKVPQAVPSEATAKED